MGNVGRPGRRQQRHWSVEAVGSSSVRLRAPRIEAGTSGTKGPHADRLDRPRRRRRGCGEVPDRCRRRRPLFPWATLAINVGGSFLLALLIVGPWSARWSPSTTNAIGIGLLGAFTTFSTFGYEAFTLARTGRAPRHRVRRALRRRRSRGGRTGLRRRSRVELTIQTLASPDTRSPPPGDASEMG